MEKITFVNDDAPYLDAENLNQLQTNIENELNLIKEQISDTGWKTVTLTSDVKAYNDNSVNIPRYRKIGNIVEIRGMLAPTRTITAGEAVRLFTLPSDCAPTGIVRYSLQQGSQKNSWLLTVYTDGNVSLQRYGTTAEASATVNVWLPFSFMYMI